MVKQNKGFNWRARAQPGGEVDLTEAKKLEGKVDLDVKKTSSGSGYEGSNAFAFAYGHTASIFYGKWIKQSVAMVFIFNLDKLSLKKLFPTMNI